MKRLILSAAMAAATLLQAQVTNIVDLGDDASERAHNVIAEDAPVVSFKYPEHWVMSVRASAHQEGHEPHLVIDDDPKTVWQVSGKPQAPMVRGHWIEFDLNRAIRFDTLSIRWLGDRPYPYKIYEKPFSDLRKQIHQGQSAGQSKELETYRLPQMSHTRAIRIEFAAEDGEEVRGIQEVRIRDLVWPDAYPPAKFPGAPVDVVRRPYYVEFERFLTWTAFNPKYPLADGGTARQIQPGDAFEGGHVDLDIAVDSEQENWITLKLWQSSHRPADSIVLQALIDDPVHRDRWFVPAFMTEQHAVEHEWYGLKPQPGRWVYASYQLPLEITRDKPHLRLRLQGIGNLRRDYPMKEAAPPVYQVRSHTAPFFSATAGKE